MRGWHVPMQKLGDMYQLVLRLRREIGLRGRVGRALLDHGERVQVSRASVQMRAKRRLRVEGGDVRRETGLPARRGRTRMQRSTKVSRGRVQMRQRAMPAGVRVLQRRGLLPGWKRRAEGRVPEARKGRKGKKDRDGGDSMPVQMRQRQVSFRRDRLQRSRRLRRRFRREALFRLQMLAFPLNLIEAETISGFDDTRDTFFTREREDICTCIYNGIAIGNKEIERKREREKYRSKFPSY